MKFKETKLELNEMSFNTTQEFSFVIINDAQEKKAFALDPCCGSCTVVFPLKTVLEPGEELRVRAEFTPTGTGEMHKCIKLVVNREVESKLWFQTQVN